MNANGVPNAPAIEVTPSRSLTLMFCVFMPIPLPQPAPAA
jgi:hypothetical protein